MAEYHWRDLHRILDIVLTLMGNHTDAAICRPLSTGLPSLPQQSGHLRNIINKNSVTINDFFVLRTHAWFKLVLMEAVGILGAGIIISCYDRMKK